MSFVWWLSPNKHENEIRFSIFQQVLHSLRKVDPMAKVNIFGSFMYGVGIPQSDLDLNVCTSHVEMSSVRGLSKCLRQSRAFMDFRVLKSAKVPIVKCKHRLSGISVDFTVNNVTGERTGMKAKALLDKYPASRAIVVFTKHLLRKKGLMDVSKGGISSFALCLMTVSFLQRLQENCRFLDALIGFLCYYGHVFDHLTSVINVGNGSLLRKSAGFAADVVYVIDPTDHKNNVSKSCRSFAKIQHELRAVHHSLLTMQHRHNVNMGARLLQLSIPDRRLFAERAVLNRYAASDTGAGVSGRLMDERNFVSHICPPEEMWKWKESAEKLFAKEKNAREGGTVQIRKKKPCLRSALISAS